jgi:uncharacterized protein DUF5760
MSDDSDLNEFRKLVKDYLNVDDIRKELRAKTKDLNEQHKEYESAIIKYMSDRDIETCNVSGGTEKLTLLNRKPSKRPNKDIIQARMIQYFNGDAEKAIKLYEFLNAEVESSSGKTTPVLKRDFTALGKLLSKSKESAAEGSGKDEEDGAGGRSFGSRGKRGVDV